MRCLGDAGCTEAKAVAPAAEVVALDAKVVALARGEGALRLRLGQLLEVLGRGGVFDLGFSSVVPTR